MKNTDIIVMQFALQHNDLQKGIENRELSSLLVRSLGELDPSSPVSKFSRQEEAVQYMLEQSRNGSPAFICMPDPTGAAGIHENNGFSEDNFCIGNTDHRSMDVFC